MSSVHAEPMAAEHEHEEGGHSIQWWGMMFFIASEALIFANLIAAYLYLEIRDQGTAATFVLPGGGHLDWAYALGNTIILLCSSIPARLGGAGIAKGNRTQQLLGLLIAIILGAIFLSGQIYEYSGLLGQHFSPSYQAFGSSFFTLTGFHALHVSIGLLFLIIIFIRSLRGDFTPKKHFGVQAAEMYWHFVDLVWVVVFTVVYILPLLFHT
jgi:cytochrome c oxidase subunit III